MLHARAGIALHARVGGLRRIPRQRRCSRSFLGGRNSRDARGFNCCYFRFHLFREFQAGIVQLTDRANFHSFGSRFDQIFRFRIFRFGNFSAVFFRACVFLRLGVRIGFGVRIGIRFGYAFFFFLLRFRYLLRERVRFLCRQFRLDWMRRHPFFMNRFISSFLNGRVSRLGRFRNFLLRLFVRELCGPGCFFGWRGIRLGQMPRNWQFRLWVYFGQWRKNRFRDTRFFRRDCW